MVQYYAEQNRVIRARNRICFLLANTHLVLNIKFYVKARKIEINNGNLKIILLYLKYTCELRHDT
jgi:hypothetical protein